MSAAAPPDDFAIAGDTVEQVVAALPAQAAVLDVGCHGWTTAAASAAIGRTDLTQIGADLHETAPVGAPDGATYLRIAGDGREFARAVADFTVARHCLEHSTAPVASFRAWLLATKPGGLIYVEAPSELACLEQADADPRGHAFRNFWDDPTHVRPWTPAALYRLALSFAATPLRCGRMMRGGIACAAILARAPGVLPEYRYVTLADTPPGVAAAMVKIWGEMCRDGLAQT